MHSLFINSLLLSALLSSAFSSSLSSTDYGIYGDVKPNLYLTGMFDPTVNPDFAPVTDFGLIFDNDYVGYIRNETGVALANMVQAFNAAYPYIELPVVSATRNYTDQDEIWTRKWFVTYSNVSAGMDRCLAILQYSSMPGTSRHHWGTDVDLYALDDIYFEYGNGKIIYDWLVENAGDYGFCQPYTEGRCAGYDEEKWHWSYTPLSMPMLNDWWEIYAFDICQFIDLSKFPGKNDCAFISPAYVSTVNAACKA